MTPRRLAGTARRLAHAITRQLAASRPTAHQAELDRSLAMLAGFQENGDT